MCVVCAVIATEFNKPLAAGLYFSKELSRHGKGAAALLYFGNQVRAPGVLYWRLIISVVERLVHLLPSCWYLLVQTCIFAGLHV